MQKNILNRSILHLFFIGVLSLIAYSNTFDYPFVFDDINIISENPVIQDLDTSIFSLKDKLRYIGHLSFALNYHVGGLDVRGYHIVNLIIHLINAYLVYFLVILTFRTPFFVLRNTDVGLQNHDPNPSVGMSLLTDHGSRFIALFSALLFVSHPVQTQAVTYIVQRFASLATLFYLLSMVTFIKGRLLSQSTERGAQGVTDREKKHLPLTLTYYFLSLLSAVFAMKTKEIAFTLPMVVILYEFSFFKTPLRKKLLFLLPILLTLVIIPLSIINIDKPIGDILSDVNERTRLQTDIPRADYIMTQMRVITTYIRLIFFPVNQNLDYDYPIYRSFLTPSVSLSFLFLLSIFGVGLYLFYASRIIAKGRAQSAEDENRPPLTYSLLPYYRLISFGIFWFFITLSVESSFIPIVDVIFEHRVYLPSVGFFIAITTSIFLVTKRLKSRWPAIDWAVIPVFAIIVMVLTGTTYARNSVWKNSLTLWQDVVNKSPNKVRGHNNLGNVYESKGLIDNAIEQYLTAIKINPYDSDTHYNLATVFLMQGLNDNAIRHFQKVIKLDPTYSDAYNNLGNVYLSQGLIDNAIEHYQIAIELDPNNLQAHHNLGIAYKSQGKTELAIRTFNNALRLRPGWELPLKELEEISKDR